MSRPLRCETNEDLMKIQQMSDRAKEVTLKEGSNIIEYSVLNIGDTATVIEIDSRDHEVAKKIQRRHGRSHAIRGSGPSLPCIRNKKPHRDESGCLTPES